MPRIRGRAYSGSFGLSSALSCPIREVNMHSDRETRIRDRAQAIWEEEGRPEGRDREHWERAAAEVDGEERTGEPEPESAKPDILKPTTAIR